MPQLMLCVRVRLQSDGGSESLSSLLVALDALSIIPLEEGAQKRMIHEDESEQNGNPREAIEIELQ